MNRPDSGSLYYRSSAKINLYIDKQIKKGQHVQQVNFWFEDV